MILDGHIHTYADDKNTAAFVSRLKDAGADGGIIISVAPSSFGLPGNPVPNAERLEDVLATAAAQEHVYPFFWLDPLEPDAADQVDRAVEQGIAGFKIICNRFEPGAPRAVDVYRRIASNGKPILFHSGIFWDDTASSQYNRPASFEALLKIAGLRFSMAHISWPWCDELTAVFGKFECVRRLCPNDTSELFIDTTPGTPASYRREAFTRLLRVGYKVEDSIVFGTDSIVNDYNVQGARDLIESDRTILGELDLDAVQQEKYFSRNLLRFLGKES